MGQHGTFVHCPGIAAIPTYTQPPERGKGSRQDCTVSSALVIESLHLALEAPVRGGYYGASHCHVIDLSPQILGLRRHVYPGVIMM